MNYFTAILSVLLLPSLCFASKQGDIKQGNKLYHQGKYEAAADKFNDALKKDSDSDIINFNLGAALYKKGDYPAAVEHFQQSFLGDDKIIQTKAHYNLGNSLYKSGVAKENTDLNAAVQSLEQALGYYEKVMAADQKDEDAKFNYEFVKKELERLKEKLKRQQQEQKNQQSKQDQKDQSQKSGQEQSQENKEQQQNQSSEESQSQGQEAQAQKQQQEEKEIQAAAEQKQTQENQNKKEEQQQSSQSTEQKDSSKQAAVLKPGDLSDKEAQMLLEDYQQTEEPRGLLNLRLQRGREREVEKDW